MNRYIYPNLEIKAPVPRAPKPNYTVKNVHCTSGTETNYSLKHLFTWINETLLTDLSDIKEMTSGAVYCQMMEVIFPRYMPLRRVHFSANSESEYNQNYIILKEAFDSLDIKHAIEMTALVKGSRVHHLQFMQWLRKFFEMNYDGHLYDPIAMRRGQDFETGRSKPRKDQRYAGVKSRYNITKESNSEKNSKNKSDVTMSDADMNAMIEEEE